MISKELLLICGENILSIININQYKLVRIIKVPNSGWIYGACMLNENILLIGDEKSTIREWKIVGDNLMLISQKENTHTKSISYLLNIGNEYLTSGSIDN